jgi:hypothetical protein
MFSCVIYSSLVDIQFHVFMLFESFYIFTNIYYEMGKIVKCLLYEEYDIWGNYYVKI